MKRTVRIIILGILLLMTVICSVVGASAEANDIYETNYNLGTRRITELTGRCNEHYIKKPNASIGNAGGNTCTVIVSYKNRIELLVFSDRAQREDLTAEIDLLYKKGMAAGILSWIYYSHPETTEIRTVAEEYEKQISIIEEKTVEESGFFDSVSGKTAEVERCYTAMLQTIYTEKINDLEADGDSDTVKALILAAPSTLGSVYKYDAIGSNGEDGENYKVFYAQTVESVNKQRSRDLVSGEMQKIFALLRPDEADSPSKLMSDFNKDIKTKNLVSEMNTLLSDTVITLLNDTRRDGAEYRNRYIDKKIYDTEVALEVANTSDIIEVMPLSVWFSKYTAELAAADAKDELILYAERQGEENGYTAEELGGLFGIVSEYTGSASPFDSAETAELVRLELTRARTRCAWFAIYRQTVGRISAFEGEHSMLLVNAALQYAETDLEISRGRRDGSTEVNQRLRSDIEKMNALVTESEAIEYKTSYRDILTKTHITSEDKDAISEALEGAETLSSAAKSFLEDLLLSLGEKYKSAAIDAIKPYNISDEAAELRQYGTDGIIALINGLAVKDGDAFAITRFRLEVESYIQKAAVIKEIVDVYCEVYLSGEGRCFSEDAESAVRSAPEAMADRAATEVKTEVVITLWRLAALERIYLAAGDNADADGVAELLSGAQTDIVEYSVKSDIDLYADTMIYEIRELIRLDEIGRRKDELTGLLAGYRSEISAYKYIDEDEKQEILDALGEKYRESLNALDAEADAEGVRRVGEAAIEELSSLADSARKKELTACLEIVKAAFVDAYGSLDNYSEENQGVIAEIIGRYEEQLGAAQTTDEYMALCNSGVDELRAVENRLEEALRKGREALELLYSMLLSKKDCYRESAFAEVEAAYEHTLSELDTYTDIADADKVTALVSERILLMSSVGMDRIHTELGELDQSNLPVYPDGYNPTTDGYIGFVTSDGGIYADMSLTISDVTTSGIEEAIRAAAKNKLVCRADGTAVGSAILKKLKSCRVLSGLDISLGDVMLASGKTYTVSALLEKGVDISEVFGIVFVRDDGTLEFFDLTADGSLISFDTTHFSSFYLVSEGEIDMTPWIICLSVIILCELAILGILITRKRRRETMSAVLPAGILAVRYIPSGGNIIVGVLGVAAASLAAVISYLLWKEIKQLRKSISYEEKPVAVVANESRVCSAVSAEAEVVDDKEDLPTGGNGEQTDKAALPETLPSVSVDEAELLMSDSEARDRKRSDYDNTEIYHGEKKAEVNIDTISQYFEDGATVTLNSLKEKRIVGSNVGYVKILARGVLDKRLTVVAQDFSASAIKMILLTGGEAYVTYPSAERGNKKR